MDPSKAQLTNQSAIAEWAETLARDVASLELDGVNLDIEGEELNPAVRGGITDAACSIRRALRAGRRNLSFTDVRCERG